jgi:hypothetical protein
LTVVSEEVLEVVDSIAFRAMDERLEFYLKRHKDAWLCRFKIITSRNTELKHL